MSLFILRRSGRKQGTGGRGEKLFQYFKNIGEAKEKDEKRQVNYDSSGHIYDVFHCKLDFKII